MYVTISVFTQSDSWRSQDYRLPGKDNMDPRSPFGCFMPRFKCCCFSQKR